MSGFRAFSHYVLTLHAMAWLAWLDCGLHAITVPGRPVVLCRCATNSRLAGDDECTFARSFELVVRAMTMMTRPFPRACLILDVIFGTMKLIVSRLLRTASRRRKGVLKSWISPI